ncbi:MAG: sulfatase [Pseudomonadota bacterium]
MMLLGCTLPHEATAADAGKPNIVFILADDLGNGDLGFRGSELAKTPHLDSFAKQGHVFSNAYAPSPQCSPTRGAILTGQYPARFHITTWIGGNKATEYKGLKLPRQKTSLPKDTFTMAKYLQASGYETAQIGKWHLGGDPKGPKQFGFDHTIGFAKGAGPGKGLDWFGPYPNIPDLDGPPEEYITDRLTTEAVEFINTERDKPFFLMFQHFDVHAPIVAPPSDVQRYVDAGRPKDEGKLNATYLAMVEQVDSSFGRIIGALKSKGLYDNTIVIFFSDNGATSWHGRNNPLRGGKKDFYEGGIRVPMLMHVPGLTDAHHTHEVPVNGIDFLPTLVELTGGDLNQIQSPLDGISLVPILKGGETLERENLFWHHPALSRDYKDIPPLSVVRQGDWKLIDFNGSFREDELYNLKEDPGEQTNLLTQYPDKAAELRALIQNHLKAVGAQMVVDPSGSPE